MNINKIAFTSWLLMFCIACSQTDDPATVIPYVPVNIEINLTNQQFNDLDNAGKRYVYLEGGVKGIILYKSEDGNFRAFERNSPFEAEAGCAVVADPSALFIQDPCSGSQFDWEGNPISGPGNIPLLRYATVQNGNFLQITN